MNNFMNNYTESIEADNLAVGTVTRLYRPGPFRRWWMLWLFLFSMWFSLTTAFAQTGLPLNFSPLSNPLPAPQLYYLDSDPSISLGDKTPLILIHGIALDSGTPSASADGWTNFCIWFYNSPSIQNRFKIYRFVYQSNQTSVQTLGNYLAQLLNVNDGSATDQQLAGKDIVILAHSMGGLVARRFMEEQRQTKAAKWNPSALRLITLATPHHGTPVANRCDYVLNPLPDYLGALGYKFKQEIGTIDFAIEASGISLFNGIFHVIPSYNQPNRLDLLWDNYDGLFTGGFSPDETNPPTATLNSISSAQSYDSKIIAYAGYIVNGSSGHDAILSSTADILANGLGIPSDGIVPIDSAWFQGRVGNSQLRFRDGYDHFQMMKSKTLAGDVPSPSDPLFTMIGNDLTNALPPVTRPTISGVLPALLPPSFSPQLITINGTNFKLPGDPNASSLVFYDPANTAYPRTPFNVTATSMQYNITVQSATGTWKVKVVNGVVESLPFSFTVSPPPTAQLSGLSINGPSSINENSSGQFTATANFTDGSSQTVTSSSTWSVNSSATTISSSGLLRAGSVGANTPVTVTAVYTTGGITKTTSANTTVVDTSGGGTQRQELIVNGNFSQAATGWQAAFNFYADNRFSTAHSPGGYAYLSNPDGSAGNNLYGEMAQTVNVPANATQVTLSYWYRITTAESGTTAFDTMTLQVLPQGANVQMIDSRSNADANGAYQQRSFDITRFHGQHILIDFVGQTDMSLPTTFRIDDVSVQAVVPPTQVLLGMGGPSSVTEGTTAQYDAIVVYSDGSIQSVTPTWSENSSATTISSSGVLGAGSVDVDTIVTVSATYPLNGVSTTVGKDVTIVNVAPTFSYLAISGPNSIAENSSGQFSATAIFTDGTSQSVTPSWSENSAATSISSGGLLTAGDVGSDTTVTVSASYTTSGVTRNASQVVLIINTPTPPTLTSLAISGASSVNENSTAQYSATAFLSDGSSQTVNPTWSEDSAATSISIFGLVSAREVVSDTSVTISASYTVGGITRNAQKTVTVVNTIVTPTYTLTVNASNGTATKNPDQANYASGIQVLLTATPTGGYQFSNWSGDATGSQNPLTVAMTTNKNITASFAVAPSSLKQLTGMNLSNSVIRFSLNGPVGSNYLVQVSSNLVNWLSFSTNTIPAAGLILITDPNMSNQSQRYYRAVLSDGATTVANMAFIPAGSFTMGDTFSEGGSTELPLHTVYVSAFYMDKYDVTKAMWDDVYQWATNHGYDFDYAGSGKAANQPVQTVDWYDTVKWCNARSEKEGGVPAYYTSAAQTTVYRSGRIGLQNGWVRWNVGYRLPTEAEWEKAARGGASGHRFPWTDTDTITHSKANYYSATNYAYDVSPTRGYPPAFNDGLPPYTSPVGYFAVNGYGLYDMAGNVEAWCWDWWDPNWFSNAQATADDTRGPDTGTNTRVLRGGAWFFDNQAAALRCANRGYWYPGQDIGHSDIGFRCARGLSF